MARFFKEGQADWYKTQTLPNQPFICGFCDTSVSSVKGYKLGGLNDGSGTHLGATYICPNCGGPVFLLKDGRMYPSPTLGSSVQHVPEALNALYQEGRRCTGQSCYTAAVLICRKMLMSIAVELQAPEGQKFIQYVEYLADKGYVPPNGRHWVDHIRRKGNEATHEIALMTEADAKELLNFVEMLLRFIYEFPKLIPQMIPAGDLASIEP